MKSRGILPLTLMLLAVAASHEAATAAFFGSEASTGPITEEAAGVSDCAFSFEGFHHAVSWYSGKNKVLIEARQACASRTGSLDLRDVTLTVLAGKRVLSRISAPDGVFSNSKKRLLITEGKSTQISPCLNPGAILSLDLITGELRSSGRRIILNSASGPECAGS